MSTMKKILSLTLALAMLMSVSVFAGFADADAIDTDAKAAVELLAAVKILNGIPQEDGTVDFAPTATIKRAEAAKMIYVLRNGGVDDGAATWKGVVSFEDCKDHWAAGYIAYCEAYGLINGRTETVFDPEAPVTGIELAKMLLTTAGYKTEAEGFTGAGWEKNVVAEANAVELFKGVKFAISDAAPRQWAAVMFKNAFAVNVPTYIGDYRVDGILTGVTAQTVQQKFLKFNDSRVTYVIATETATLNGTFAAKGKVVLADGTETFAVADALVGQQVKVTTIDGKIVTIAATGKTIAGELKVGAKITSGTDKDKYPVTVGGTAIGNKAAADVICGALTVQNVLDQQAKKGNWVAYTAYDIEGDKAVDYVLTTTTTYGVVNSIITAEGDTKGDFKVGGTYIDVSDAKVTVNGTMKADIVAKYTVDPLTGKTVVAPADVVMGSFTGVSGTGADTKFTVGGTQYQYADDALEKAFLSSTSITELVKDTVVLYTDGKYIVKAVKYVAETGTTTPTTPTELPANLAMLIEAQNVTTSTTSTDAWGNVTNTPTVITKVKVLLADGTTIILPYETASTIVKDAEHMTKDEVLASGIAGNVFEYVITANGKILFKQALPTVQNVVYYGTNANGAVGAAVTYNTTSKLLTGITDKFIMATENTKVFVKYLNDKDTDNTKWTTEYKVMTVAELAAYEIDALNLIAASNATIGEGLLATAEASYKAPSSGTTSSPVAHYVVATSGVSYVVEGEKIYKVFTAIDLKNGCAAATFKAEVKETGTADTTAVVKGAILNLSTTDGLVTSATAATGWTDASIQAKVSDLLLVDGAIWQTTGNVKFASNCKVILKNGDTYVAGTIDNLTVAKFVSGSTTSYEQNIKYVMGTGDNATKVAYVIIDLAKTK